MLDLLVGRECCSEISIGCFDDCCQIGFMSLSRVCWLSVVHALTLSVLGLVLWFGLANDTHGELFPQHEIL
jgi:hypothetical protein